MVLKENVILIIHFFKLQYVVIIDFIQKGAYQSYKSVKFYVDQQTLRSTQLAVLAWERLYLGVESLSFHTPRLTWSVYKTIVNIQ